VRDVTVTAPKPRPFYTKLYFQVLVGLVVGVLLGHFYPQLAVQMKPFGDAFVKLIKMVIAPLIFATVVVGIAKMGDLKELGRVGIKSIIYFEVVTTIALIVGLVVVNVIRPGAGINADPKTLDAGSISAYVSTAQKSSGSFVDFLMGIIPSSVIDAFAKGDLLPVLLFSVLFGLALCFIGRWTTTLIDVLDQAAHGLFGVVGIIMKFAPLGAFGAMAFTIGKYGLGTLVQMGSLIVAVYTTCILFVVVVLGSILWMVGINVWKFLRYFKDEILIVFGATSAEAMIPRLMVKLENMGCSKPIVGLVIPAGFSFNMDGTAIYMTMGVMFIAQACNIELTLAQQFGILMIMLFTSKGAAGVTGGGFIALAATMPAIDVLPIGGLALLVGIDRFMAEIRAASNLAGNAVATAVIAAWEKELDWDKARRALDGEELVAEEPEKVHEIQTEHVPA
jgi:aerobic C4-dicarboxylate transport protein